MTTTQIYQALGLALRRLDDPTYAAAEGFFGERKEARLLRTAHARASTFDSARLGDLGRLIADNLSPRSQIAGLCEALFSSVSQDP